jgi:hypothetical protein
MSDTRTVATITTTGGIEIWQLPNDPEQETRALGDAVGGWIQAIRIGDRAIMYVNEEGKLRGLPINAIARQIAKAAGLRDIIVGPAVLVGYDGTADIASLPPDWLNHLKKQTMNLTCDVCRAQAIHLPGDLDSSSYLIAAASGWRLRQVFGQWTGYCSDRCAKTHGYL